MSAPTQRLPPKRDEFVTFENAGRCCGLAAGAAALVGAYSGEMRPAIATYTCITALALPEFGRILDVVANGPFLGQASNNATRTVMTQLGPQTAATLQRAQNAEALVQKANKSAEDALQSATRAESNSGASQAAAAKSAENAKEAAEQARLSASYFQQTLRQRNVTPHTS